MDVAKQMKQTFTPTFSWFLGGLLSVCCVCSTQSKFSQKLPYANKLQQPAQNPLAAPSPSANGSAENTLLEDRLSESDHIVWIGFKPPLVRKKIIESLQAARRSIHLAWYSFDDAEILQALKEIAPHIPIYAITSYDNQHSSAWKQFQAVRPISLQAGNQNGLMHNKYVIIDRQFVITGSANFSADFSKHFNVTTIIQSQRIAQQFLIDFQLLENHYYGSEKKQGFSDLQIQQNASAPFFQQKIPLGQTLASVYFTPYRSIYPAYRNSTASTHIPSCTPACIHSVPASQISGNCDSCSLTPCLMQEPPGIIYRFFALNKATPRAICRRYDNAFNVILPELATARKEILVLAFALRDSLFIDRLIAARKRGVRVRVYIDYSQYRSALPSVGATYQNMQALGLEMYITRHPDNGLLHHKTILIDNDRLILGSLNFSQSAVTINDENFIVFTNAAYLAPLIQQEARNIHRYSVPESASLQDASASIGGAR